MDKINTIIVTIVSLLVLSVAVLWFVLQNRSNELKNNVKKVKIFSTGGKSSFDTTAFGEPLNNTETGNEEAGEAGADNNKGTETTSQTIIKRTELLQLFDLPVAGVGFIGDNDTVIFTAKADGYSYTKSDIYKDAQKSAQNARSHIFNADYSDNIIMRTSFDGDLNFIYDLEPLNDTKNLIELDENLSDCKLSKKDLFCLQKDDLGKSKLLKTSLDDPEPKLLYESDFSEMKILYANDELVYLEQYPAYGKLSYLMKISKDAKGPILSGMSLDAKISKNGKYVLFNRYDNGSYKLYIKDLLNNTQVSELSIDTLAQKCVIDEAREILYCAVPQTWFTNRNIPDDWLKGKINYNDAFYSYDLKKNTLSKLAVKNDGNFDVYKIHINKNGDIITFVNKFDSKAWALTIKYKDEKNNDGADEEDKSENNDNNEKDEEKDIELKPVR